MASHRWKRCARHPAPDGTGNPYLALAAIVSAGADGVERQLDPGEPFEGTLKDATERFGPRPLPRNLREALEALQRDSGYLTAAGAFPQGLIDFWCEYKWAESEAIMLRPHPWEYNLYYGS